MLLDGQIEVGEAEQSMKFLIEIEQTLIGTRKVSQPVRKNDRGVGDDDWYTLTMIPRIFLPLTP